MAGQDKSTYLRRLTLDTWSGSDHFMPALQGAREVRDTNIGEYVWVYFLERWKEGFSNATAASSRRKMSAL